MLLVLTGVTAISVALLAYVNELTKEPIAQANAKTLSDAVSAVVPGFDNDPIAEKKMQAVNGVDYAVYPATKGGEFIGAAVEASSMAFGGELKVLVGFDAEGNIIDYSLLSHVETPGLGSKAADWFKEGNKGSIKGMNPGKTPLSVSKDGGQVDAITASTITSRAFLNAVNAAYQAYKGGEVDTNSGASQKNEPAVAPEGDFSVVQVGAAEHGREQQHHRDHQQDGDADLPQEDLGPRSPGGFPPSPQHDTVKGVCKEEGEHGGDHPTEKACRQQALGDQRRA